MSTERNKEIVRRVLEDFWHNGDQAVLDEVLAPDFVNHDLSGPEVRGLDAFKEWANSVRAALQTGFPDGRITIEDLIGEGDRVAKRYVFRGTHTGEYMGIPATGKKVLMRAVSIYEFKNGKVSENWWNYDAFGLLQQLGAT